MLTAARLIEEAQQNAKCEHYDTQALELLNVILGDLCETTSLALARGTFSFSFNPQLATVFGSGPYKLPLDYLRTSDSSGAEGVARAAFYTPTVGEPMFMVPVDLAEFDVYVKQAGVAGFPSTWATDMGGPLTDRIVLTTVAKLTAASLTAVAIVATGLVAGLSVAGEGIVPGTEIDAVSAFSLATTGNTNTSAILTNLASTTGVLPGHLVTHTGVPVGTVVNSVDSASQVTMSAAATVTLVGGAVTFSGTALTLSAAATATLAAASVFFGIAPVGYAYPPPLGAHPVTIRYQRKMPMITDIARVPWFPNGGFLLDKLTARLMAITDDSRIDVFHARADRELGRYLALADDKTNRSQAVQLDARQFGGGGGLRNTKRLGW